MWEQPPLVLFNLLPVPISIYCRICLRCRQPNELHDFVNIFTQFTETKLIAEVIKDFAEIEIEQHDKHSKVICSPCLETMINVVDFKALIRNSASKLDNTDFNMMKAPPTYIIDREIKRELEMEEVHIKVEPDIDPLINNEWNNNNDDDENSNSVDTQNEMLQNVDDVIESVVNGMPKCADCEEIFETNIELKKHYSLCVKSSYCSLCNINYVGIHSCGTRTQSVEKTAGDDNDDKSIQENKLYNDLTKIKIPFTEISDLFEENDYFDCNEQIIDAINSTDRINSYSNTIENVINDSELNDSTKIPEEDLLTVQKVVCETERDDDCEIKKYRNSKKQFNKNLLKLDCTSKGGLLRHPLSMHNKKGYHVCKICGKTYKYLAVFKTHRLTHEVKKGQNNLKHLKCTKCYQQFPTRTDFKAHLFTHLRRKFNCETCDKSFVTKNAHLKHAQLHKKSPKLLQCKKCGKSFKGNNGLNMHMRSCQREEKNYECQECDKKFVRATQLGSHQRFHSKHRSHACDICQFRFKNKASLFSHKTIAHSNQKKKRRNVSKKGS